MSPKAREAMQYLHAVAEDLCNSGLDAEADAMVDALEKIEDILERIA